MVYTPVIVPIISDGNSTAITPTDVLLIFIILFIMVIAFCFFIPLIFKIMDKSEEFWDKVFKKRSE